MQKIKHMFTQSLACLVAAALMLGALPGGVPRVLAAAPTALNISDGSIVIGGGSLTVNGAALTPDPGNSYTITQTNPSTPTANSIRITGGTVSIGLEGVNIQGSGAAAIDVAAGASVTLLLSGANRAQGGISYAGIHVPPGATLTIGKANAGDADSAATLTATGGNVPSSDHHGAGAGIGGNGGDVRASGEACGIVRVTGGAVTANGGSETNSIYGGAGIGGGSGGREALTDGGGGGTVTISGGVVRATGGGNDLSDSGAAGIGGASALLSGGSGGTVTISGGAVTASSTGFSAGIGGGTSSNGGFANGGTVIISGGTVVATSAYGVGIGGHRGNGGTVTIIGGSVNASIQAQPTNGTENVYRSTITGLGASVPITALSLTQGSALGYGAGDMQTVSGSLYLWLPAYATGTTTAILTAGSVSYRYSGSVSNNNNNTLAQEYLVSFDANSAAATGSMPPQVFAPGTAQNLTANAFSCTGSVFAGWGATSGAPSATYADGQSVTIGSDTTLYALWLKTPTIVASPASATKTSGATATFTVSATGDTLGTLSYQWQKNTGSGWSAIAGAANANSYTTPALSWGDSGDQYRCVVTNTLGTVQMSADSEAATLTVNRNAPTVSTPAALPVSPAAYPGNVQFSATLGSYAGTLGAQTIDFYDGATKIGSGTTDSGGVATFTWTSPGVGGYAVTAKFTGDTDNTAATSGALSYSVGKGSQSALALSQTSLTKTYGDAAFDVSALVSGGSGTGALVYNSTDTDVLTVDSTGQATIHKAGSASVNIYRAADGNFNQSATVSLSVTVNPKSVTPVATADSKTYDGTTAATGSITLTGVINGDAVTAGGTFAFADASAGNGKTVHVTGITLSGAAKGNYALSVTTATATANIAAAPATPTPTPTPTPAPAPLAHQLSGIRLSAGSLSTTFNPDVTGYTVNLGENDASVTVRPYKAYGKATMTIDGRNVTSKTIKLANGSAATMTVKVTWNKKTTTYRLTIRRPKSTNANLVKLTANRRGATITPQFHPDVTSYTVRLPKGTYTATLNWKVAQKDARVYVNGKFRNNWWLTLCVRAPQKIAIVVRAQNENEKTYTVTVVSSGYILTP